MFKPRCILQVGFIALLLAGCASTRTATLPVAANSAMTRSTNPDLSAPKPQALDAVTIVPPKRPSIKAGMSTAGNTGFIQANGDLAPDIQAFANEVAQSRAVPASEVQNILKAASFNATAARLMAPAKTPIRRSWISYRNRFVEPVRINAGVEFWTRNRSMLDTSARIWGVPPSIIVAIIGVETIYGRNTGNFRVLDALATLGFRYPDSSRPERSQLFRDQLADLIELHHQGKLDAYKAQGSYAGAIGLPQFMPGSLMRYAVDGDKDGRIDLLGSPADAIASVANFLRQHGWEPGLPVFAPVILPADAQKLVAGGLYPTLAWAQLQAQGAVARPGVSGATDQGQLVATAAHVSGIGPGWENHKLGVIDLLDEPRNLAEYRTGTPNFFAITHYNRSYFYAASVADLAQELADRMGYGGPN